MLLIGILAVQSSVGLGGLISELLVGRAGVADSNLLVGSATSSELTVVGFAPIVSTQPVTGLGAQTATFEGRVTNMNGLPTATGYFEWGYSASTMTNTTTTFPITATGNYDLTVTGFAGSGTVYYRFVTDADGTAYGAVTHFPAGAGVGTSILRTILRVILAASIVITVFLIGSRGGMTALLIAGIVGVIGFVIIDNLLGVLL